MTHKLGEAERRRVIECVIAGLSNDQTRAKSREFGFQGELSRQGLDYCRKLPDVQDAIAQVTDEHKQAGMGHRGRRLALTSRVIQELEHRMFGTFEREHEGLAPTPAELGPFLAAATLLEKYLALMSKILDVPPTRSAPSPRGATALTDPEARNPVAQMTIGQVNDILERFLKMIESGEGQNLPAHIGEES